jgi:poly(ADP-ribose) glycohydrolase ARH3
MAVATRELLFDKPIAQVVTAVRARCPSPEIGRRLDLAVSWINEGVAPGPAEVAVRLGNGTTAPASCVTALYIALRHLGKGFEEMMQFVVSCRGDVDTIGAMAGALWGASNGSAALPHMALEGRDRIREVADRLFIHATTSSSV